MHKSVIGKLAVAAVIAWAFGAPAFAADSKAEITELEHKFAESTTIGQAMGFMDASDDLVVYDVSTPREFDGPAAVGAQFQNYFATAKNPKAEFLSLHVTTDGKLGIAESVQHFSYTDKSGKSVDSILRQTDVWRKEKDGWKIIHSHISYPVDLASGKADMHSK
jgi:ketosteroid isomerase-like protein